MISPVPFKAADVCWNQPFKANIRKLYDRWMINDAEKEFTEAGNPRAPAMSVYLSWVVSAWKALPEEIIRKSFKGG